MMNEMADLWESFLLAMGTGTFSPKASMSPALNTSHIKHSISKYTYHLGMALVFIVSANFEKGKE